MQIGNIIIRRASNVKKAIRVATERAESGDEDRLDARIYYAIIGIYEARLFGICISRAHSCDFIDKITDRYDAVKSTNHQS